MHIILPNYIGNIMKKYTLSMRAIHWLMAVMILSLIPFGLWMAELPDSYPGKYDYYAIHKSFGLVALLFIILRVSNRLRSTVPSLPKEINKTDSLLSSLTIGSLYLCMFAMPISGYLMSTFGGHPVMFFNILVPALFDKNLPLAKFFHDMHGLGGWVLIALISLHLLGTLKHYFVEKVNLLQRIW